MTMCLWIFFKVARTNIPSQADRGHWKWPTQETTCWIRWLKSPTFSMHSFFRIIPFSSTPFWWSLSLRRAWRRLWASTRVTLGHPPRFRWPVRSFGSQTTWPRARRRGQKRPRRRFQTSFPTSSQSRTSSNPTWTWSNFSRKLTGVNKQCAGSRIGISKIPREFSRSA